MSFKISGSLKGAQKLYKQIQGMQKEILEPQIAAVRESVFLIHKTAVELIQENNDGDIGVRYTNGNKRFVVVSRPGDPPNTDRGRLVQSIKFDFKDGGLVGRVGTNLRYGAFLEFGTLKMAARPWLSTAINMTKDQVAKIFAKEVRKYLKGVDA